MAHKKIFLLSHILSSRTPGYSGKKDVTVHVAKAIRQGDSCNMKKACLSFHAGTHVDAPLHFLDRGRSIAEIKPESWVFSRVRLARIIVKPDQLITSKDMPRLGDCDLLLLKTGFEKHRGKKAYWRNSPGLSLELADFLRKRCPSLRAIGVDLISISGLSHREEGRKAHKSFLGNNILLIEDMKLSLLQSAPKRILVSPVFFEKADGAPCTIWGFGDR